MKKALCILTCFNRKAKTQNCIRTIAEYNPGIDFSFVVVDDNSNDGTKEMLADLQKEYSLFVIDGDGSLFYSGGMRRGMAYALEHLEADFDFLLMVNDDVEFLPGTIEAMTEQSGERHGAVIVGAMKDEEDRHSYGAIKYTRSYRYRQVGIDEWDLTADTFNANCVLIPYRAFHECGPIDNHYVHSLGDFDYGLALKRHGFKIYTSRNYCGICNKNSDKGTWLDKNMGRIKRLLLKENVKGAPLKQWFYFLKKNFGLIPSVLGSISPYIRIMLGK